MRFGLSNVPIYWLTIPPQDGWLVTQFGDKHLVSLFSSSPDRHFTSLKVAGYHMGETKWIGEHRNIMAIKIEAIPNILHVEMLPKIRKSLSDELQGVEISFLDDSYLLAKKK